MSAMISAILKSMSLSKQATRALVCTIKTVLSSTFFVSMGKESSRPRSRITWVKRSSGGWSSLPIRKRQILHKFVENVRIANLKIYLKTNKPIIPVSYAMATIYDQQLNSLFSRFEICNNYRWF